MSAPDQSMAGPSLEDRLREVLPSWTHWGGGAPLFPGFTATWTTTAGTWSIGTSGISPWPALEGPGGKWAFGRRDADHIIGVLRALDAIPETPGAANCDTCEGKGTIRCESPSPCIDCHGEGVMGCPDCAPDGAS